MNYTPASVKNVALSVLDAYGCDPHEARVVADHLVDANLAGHDSHGIGMLPLYGENVLAGHLVPNQVPELYPPIGAITTVDAKRGFGHRMALLALDHAMKTVDEHKVAILGMRNSGHVSRLGAYSEYCASKGYVSFHMVNVTGHAPLVAPYGAKETGFSTNPISIGFPDADGAVHPMLDMATSTIAFGKVRVANNKGEQVPPGSLLDADGIETRDPAKMAEERIGALAAFGGHKGSGLGIFIELLTGALAGTGTVAEQEGLPYTVINTMFSVIIDPTAFDDVTAIQARVDTYYHYIKSRAPAKGTSEVLMPGDPENISRAERNRNGIPVDDETLNQIFDIGSQFGLNADKLRAQLVIA